MQVLLVGKKLCESATIKCKQGCSLKPKSGSFLEPLVNLKLCLVSISNIKIRYWNTYIFSLQLFRHIFHQGVSHSRKYTYQNFLIFLWFLIFLIIFLYLNGLLKLYVTFHSKFHRILHFLYDFFFFFVINDFLKNCTIFFQVIFLSIFLGGP